MSAWAARTMRRITIGRRTGGLLANCYRIQHRTEARHGQIGSIKQVHMKPRSPTFLLAACILTAVSSCVPEPLDAMWPIRMDSTEDVNKPDRFTLLPGGGIEAKGGGNATMWRPDVPLRPPYRLSMRVTATNLGLHPHGAGIVFGGNDVDNDKQAYSYFLARGDGQFLIKTRDGGDTSDICLWSEHASVSKDGEKSSIATNVLTIDVDKEATRFSINGTQVHEAKTETLHASGQYGARLVHDLDVRFDQIEIAAKK